MLVQILQHYDLVYLNIYINLVKKKFSLKKNAIMFFFFMFFFLNLE